MIHAKTAVADGVIALVGSSNLILSRCGATSS
jgi:hypothetical protein